MSYVSFMACVFLFYYFYYNAKNLNSLIFGMLSGQKIIANYLSSLTSTFHFPILENVCQKSAASINCIGFPLLCVCF